jgi:hypothetical protein
MAPVGIIIPMGDHLSIAGMLPPKLGPAMGMENGY